MYGEYESDSIYAYDSRKLHLWKIARSKTQGFGKMLASLAKGNMKDHEGNLVQRSSFGN